MPKEIGHKQPKPFVSRLKKPTALKVVQEVCLEDTKKIMSKKRPNRPYEDVPVVSDHLNGQKNAF